MSDRNYDAGIGAFSKPDRLWEKFRAVSPYNYCDANPVRLTDPDGMQVNIDKVTGEGGGGAGCSATEDEFFSNPFKSKGGSEEETNTSESTTIENTAGESASSESRSTESSEPSHGRSMDGTEELPGTKDAERHEVRRSNAGNTSGSVPQKAADVLSHVESTGNAPDGYKGGKEFKNDGRSGGEVLPKVDASGNSVTYREYDVNPYQKGVNRGGERIVVDSNGNGYYTGNHYKSFTPMK